MDETLNKLGLVHIRDATIDAVAEIKARKDGLIVPLKTRWTKFNTLLGGGLEWKTLTTIAGMSGSGKSSIANELETALIDHNPKEKFVVLSWNYEMTNASQVIRKVSYKMNLTVGEIKSGNKIISNKQFEDIRKVAGGIIDYPIYYAEKARGVTEMVNMVREFHHWVKCKFGADYGLVCFLDHSRLVKKIGSEFEMLSDLQEAFITLKKEDKRLIVQLSQLNRGIESPERKFNPSGQFPDRTDLFGSDALFQSSDIVIVSHRPETINLRSYGQDNYAVKDKVYIHALKLREGEPAPIRFLNNLKYNRIDEDPVLPTPNEVKPMEK